MPPPKIEPFYRDLGRRVEAVRRERHLTQEQLGSRLVPPLKRVTVSNIETGKQRVLAHVLVDFARVLEVTLAELVPAAPASQPADSPDLHVQLATGLKDPALARAVLENIASLEEKKR